MMRWGRGGSLRHSRTPADPRHRGGGDRRGFAGGPSERGRRSLGARACEHPERGLSDRGQRRRASTGSANAHSYTDQILVDRRGDRRLSRAQCHDRRVRAIGIDHSRPRRGCHPRPVHADLGAERIGALPVPAPSRRPDRQHPLRPRHLLGERHLRRAVSTPYAAAHSVSVGDTLTLSPVANCSLGTSYKVTGTFGVPPTILGPTGAFAVLLPLSDLQTMTGYAGRECRRARRRGHNSGGGGGVRGDVIRTPSITFGMRSRRCSRTTGSAR